MIAPIVRTPRLTLRPHVATDLDAAFAMWSDPIVTRFIGGKPSTYQQTWSRVMTYTGHWALLGFGYWAVEEAATGAFIGECGFADFKRDIAPSMQGVPELGFAFSPAVHGKGYATEAVTAAIAWIDANRKAKRTVCLVSPENHPSRRVVEKHGYRAFEETLFGGVPTMFFERVKNGQL